jgi:hypothetical protein
MVARLFCEAIEVMDKAEMVKKADQAVGKEVKKVVGEQAESLAIRTPCMLRALDGCQTRQSCSMLPYRSRSCIGAPL